MAKGNEEKDQNKKFFLLNNSNRTIYYKQEEGIEPIPLKPGERTYELVDGINVGGKVYKVTDGYLSVKVDANGKVYLQYNPIIFWDASKALYAGGLIKR